MANTKFKSPVSQIGSEGKFNFKSNEKSLLIGIGGIALIVLPLLLGSKPRPGDHPTNISTSTNAIDSRNPRLTMFERFFCTGNRTMSGCPERGLHPTEEQVQEAMRTGMSREQAEQQFQWTSNPSNDNNRAYKDVIKLDKMKRF